MATLDTARTQYSQSGPKLENPETDSRRYMSTSDAGAASTTGQTIGDGMNLDDLREGAPPVMGANAASAVAPETPDVAKATAASIPSAVDAAASGAKASKADAVQAEATGYNAQTGEVDADSMTAAGQLNQITRQDSANMRRASEQGMLAAGRRGLQNSSIAAGAAQGAMVDRATPLAQQDAATYFKNMRANLDAVNRAREVSTGRETDVSGMNAQLGTQVSLADAAAANQAELQRADLETRVAQQNAESQNRLNELQAQLDTAVSQQNAEAANRIQQQMADIQAAINTRNAELQTQVSMENAGAVNRINEQVLRGNQELNKQFLAGEQAIDLQNIQGRFNQLISSNDAAAQIYNSYISAIGSAMANHEVTPGRIAQYINVMAQQLEGSLELIDAMNGLDLGGIDLPGARGTGGTGDGSRVDPGSPGSIGGDTGGDNPPDVGIDPGSIPGFNWPWGGGGGGTYVPPVDVTRGGTYGGRRALPQYQEPAPTQTEPAPTQTQPAPTQTEPAVPDGITQEQIDQAREALAGYSNWGYMGGRRALY